MRSIGFQTFSLSVKHLAFRCQEVGPDLVEDEELCFVTWCEEFGEILRIATQIKSLFMDLSLENVSLKLLTFVPFSQ